MEKPNNVWYAVDTDIINGRKLFNELKLQIIFRLLRHRKKTDLPENDKNWQKQTENVEIEKKNLNRFPINLYFILRSISRLF